MTIEEGSPIRLENISNAMQFRNQADNANLTHTSDFHSGTAANLLTAINPSFVNWTQNPGTNANMTDDADMGYTALTTSGIGAAGDNTITWDLGSIRRRVVSWNCDESIAMFISSDDVTYKQATVTAYGGSFATNFRYLRLVKAGVFTMSNLGVACYNIN